MTRDGTDEVPWLDDEERPTWIVMTALMSLLPAAVDSEMQKRSGLNFFEYTVLAMLSEQPGRTMRMSQLAGIAAGSLSRLSHAARRLESRGLLRRAPLPGDGRVTVATLTDDGLAALEAAAPAHVREVRRVVFDPLSESDVRELRRIGLLILGGLDHDITSVIPDFEG